VLQSYTLDLVVIYVELVILAILGCRFILNHGTGGIYQIQLNTFSLVGIYGPNGISLLVFLATIGVLIKEFIGIHLSHSNGLTVFFINNYLILIIRISFNQLTTHIQFVVIHTMDTSALSAAAVFELEGEVVAINLN